MCIGVPVRLIARTGADGTGEADGVQCRISLALVPEALIGDYLLVHAGCALQVIDAQAAAETLQLLKELADEAS